MTEREWFAYGAALYRLNKEILLPRALELSGGEYAVASVAKRLLVEWFEAHPDYKQARFANERRRW